MTVIWRFCPTSRSETHSTTHKCWRALVAPPAAVSVVFTYILVVFYQCILYRGGIVELVVRRVLMVLWLKYIP